MYFVYQLIFAPPPPPKQNSSVLLSLKSSQIDIDAEDDDGWTALHAAVYWGNMDIADELVMHGANVNKKTKLVRHLPYSRKLSSLWLHTIGTYKFSDLYLLFLQVL